MIKFIESSHRYLQEDGADLTSVSALFKKFQPKLDWTEIARKFAIKQTKAGNPITTKEVQKLWKDKGDRASEVGTLFHSIREAELVSETNPIFYDVPCETKQCTHVGAEKFSIPINDIQNNTVYPELMIYDRDYMICGQSDKVIVVDNKINIWDYKGLALDTEIPISHGFLKMKDIKVGHSLYDGNGNPTTVTAISDIHHNPCYKITFDDKSEIVCDHEHKWLISKRLAKSKYKELELRSDDLFKLHKNKSVLRIKCTSIYNKSKDLPIEPYILGLWLGDGCKATGRLTNMNDKIWNEITKRGYQLGEDISNGNCGKAQLRTIIGLRTKLKQYNLLNNKHIPDIYFRASFEQKLDLLRGFMDTDGYFNISRKRCVMVTTKKWQTEALRHLISSLGWKATVINAKTSGFGKTNIPCFHITFTPIMHNPFLSKSENYLNICKTVPEKAMYRYIKNIEVIETVLTKCITVDSPTHTYLATRSYIKTHNTDKEIAFKAYSSEWVKPRKLLTPLNNLDDANGNHYAIKMSIYMYMLWKANKGRFKTGDIIIEHVHLKRDEEGIPVLEDGKPVVLKIGKIKLPYYKKEVEAIFKTLE